MCMNLMEANDIIAASREQPHLVVQVGTMRRYAPAFELACSLLSELGEIRLARVHDVIGKNALFIKDTSRVIRGNDIPADILAEGQHLQEKAIVEAIAIEGTIGEVDPELRSVYSHLLGLSTHDISATRELLGMPQGVLYATHHRGGPYLTAAFDYGGYVCQFETGVDNIPRFDAYLEVYGTDRVLRVQYDTLYVRNLPIYLPITEANGKGGVVERVEHPSWGDPFVVEWEAFYENIAYQRTSKTSPADFRQDLELFSDMIALMRG